MKVTVYSLRPFYDINGFFIDPPGGSFDPKHPSIYPGDEVQVRERLTPELFLEKYGRERLYSQNLLYTGNSRVLVILDRTGRTSADVVHESR